MINLKLSKNSTNTLKMLINKRIDKIYFCKQFNSIYGEIYFCCEDAIISLTNFEFNYSDGEFPRFKSSIVKIFKTSNLDFIQIDDVINSIEIVDETIIIDKNIYAENCIAITLKGNKNSYTISKDWLFSEIINFNLNFNYKDLRTIQDTISDWTNESFKPITAVRKIKLL